MPRASVPLATARRKEGRRTTSPKSSGWWTLRKTPALGSAGWKHQWVTSWVLRSFLNSPPASASSAARSPRAKASVSESSSSMTSSSAESRSSSEASMLARAAAACCTWCRAA
jgi:hypothetical protein